jgi:hypothetical protein
VTHNDFRAARPLENVSSTSFVGRGFSRDIKTEAKLGFSPWRFNTSTREDL